MKTIGSTVWCGITFTDNEAKRWIDGSETRTQTLNNILESGLPVLEDQKAGIKLTRQQNALMQRIDEIVQAAKIYGLVAAECNEQLLIAFGFKSAAAN